jgi:hypothetical protein
MKKVIDFICEQGLELHDYPKLVEPLKQKFDIRHRHNNENATEELITAVMYWEKHTEIYDSLEKFLNDRFTVKQL